ncbi:MAG: hypothetical protein MMC33_008637 [Icmadophila ericetorum]|nr:hypothetical protein [Icmadophila ericetorum]
MDDLLQQNKQFLLDQIAAYEAEQTQAKAEDTSSDTDTLIGVRVRPLLEKEVESGQFIGVSTMAGGGQAAVHELRRKVTGKLALTSSGFQLDKVYGIDSTSEDVYRDLVIPLVPWSWGGGVSTLFAYGQTGSGKTYTIDALERITAELLMGGGLEGNREVFFCIFELAGKDTFDFYAIDLLNDRRRISVMEDSFGESQLVGIVEHKPGSADELLKLIDKGMSFRTSAATLKNDSSSRSHAVCRIRIVNKDDAEVPDGLLFLVDLAGSEAAADSKDHTAERMKETRETNISLSVLKDCIRGRAIWSTQEVATASGKKTKPVHIPYRSSVLTKVLKHVFDVKGDRSCKTAVLACVTPCARDAAVSKNTLRYAELLRIPVPKPKPVTYNALVPSTWPNKKLREWIDNNSGTPPVSSFFLAPNETGPQLLKLPKGTFVSRCLRTPSVTASQARAFYDKLWRLHIDSRSLDNDTQTPILSEEEQILGKAEKDRAETPFQYRIQPGMFVRLRNFYAQYEQIVVILSPEDAFLPFHTPLPEYNPRAGDEKWGTGNKRRFICAHVVPGLYHESWNLMIEQLRVVRVGEMEAQVNLEWDGASRYYYVKI